MQEILTLTGLSRILNIFQEFELYPISYKDVLTLANNAYETGTHLLSVIGIFPYLSEWPQKTYIVRYVFKFQFCSKSAQFCTAAHLLPASATFLAISQVGPSWIAEKMWQKWGDISIKETSTAADPC